MSNWQLELLSDQLKEFDQRNKRRKELASILLKKLSDETLSRVPIRWQTQENNTFYHIPFCTNGLNRHEFLKKLLAHGVDTCGYGLNLCTEEIVFQHITTICDGARAIKHETIFIPLHESFATKQIEKIADIFNEVTKDS